MRHTIRVKEESLLDFSILLSLFKVLDVSFLLNPRTSNPIATCHNIKETKMRQGFAVQPDINQKKGIESGRAKLGKQNLMEKMFGWFTRAAISTTCTHLQYLDCTIIVRNPE
jgi:hypothetical protein